ncbi:MAG: ferritin-like domain-containing protein [bacterium JZ-2024 1]
MGEKGREIIGVPVNEVIGELQKAYSDEWLACYQYVVSAWRLAGLNAPEVAEELKKQGMQELEHAEELAKRILELGGEPVLNPKDLLSTSGCGYITPPKNQADVEQVCRDVVQAERCAIAAYKKLADLTFGKDYVTHQLALHILAEEVAHEEMFENFLQKL